jgi:predicted kinase
MGSYGLLLLLVLPAYFIYAISSSLRAARQRRDDAASRFGTFYEHPQEDLESLHAQWELQKTGAGHEVDDITWSDLDMDRVFHRINTCLTTPGEETLYLRLRTLPGTEEDWEQALLTLDENPDLRLKIQLLLAGLGKNSESGMEELLLQPDSYRLPHAGLLRIAAFLPLAAAVMFFLPVPPGAAIMTLLPALILNAYLYYWGGKRLQGRLHTIRYIKSLLWCARKLTRLPMPDLQALQTAMQHDYRPFSHMRGALSGAVQEGMAAGDIGGLMMFVQVFFLTELRAYNRVMTHIAKHTNELKSLYEAVGRLDVMIAALSLRKSLNTFCLPRFHEQMALEVKDAVHPLLENGVGNSADFQHGVLITGSNASGKSTFIKTLAVNAILAQSINTCSAASFTLPRARVMSSMALRDNLAGGESYFVVEVKSFRRILQAVKSSPCLCFVDEILRGTNTVERIAASAAVLRSLQQGSSLCVAATHDIELASILSGLYDNYHFQEELKDKSIHFDYKLRPGPSHTRNALLLLQAFDFPGDVVKDAMEMVNSFEQEHRWPVPEDTEGGGSPAPSCAG